MKEWTDTGIVEWHKKFFPKATMQTQLLKIESEMREVHMASGYDNFWEEIADVYIAATAAEMRFGSEMAKIVRRQIQIVAGEKLWPNVNAKMAINVNRKFKGDHHVEKVA